MRLVVTGSRDFNDPKLLVETLDQYYDMCVNVEAFLMAVGDCPTGADEVARSWYYQLFGHDPKIYKARWDQYGSYGGPERNERMLREFKPDHVVACLQPGVANKGTLGTVSLATRAGIRPTFVWSRYPVGRGGKS